MFRGLWGGALCVGTVVGPDGFDGVHGLCGFESGAGQGGEIAGAGHHAGPAGTGGAHASAGGAIIHGPGSWDGLWLPPLAACGDSSLTLDDYLTLVDATGKTLVMGKRGRIDPR